MKYNFNAFLKSETRLGRKVTEDKIDFIKCTYIRLIGVWKNKNVVNDNCCKMDEQYSLVKRVKMKSFIPRETDARIQEEEIQELVFLTR